MKQPDLDFDHGNGTFGPDLAGRAVIRNYGLDEAEAQRLARQSLARAAKNHAGEMKALVPIARALAAAPRGRELGITVSTLRAAALEAGILTGSETGRDLSYLGAVMTAAGLLHTGEYRRSELAVTHGNLQAVWRLTR